MQVFQILALRGRAGKKLTEERAASEKAFPAFRKTAFQHPRGNKIAPLILSAGRKIAPRRGRKIAPSFCVNLQHFRSRGKKIAPPTRKKNSTPHFRPPETISSIRVKGALSTSVLTLPRSSGTSTHKPIHKPVFYETMVSDISYGKRIGFAS